jgi:hypothetical protein
MRYEVYINGEKLQIDIEGLRHGDQVKHVWAQCEGCGSSLDAEATAFLHGANRSAIKCSECGMVYPIARHS